MNSTFAGPGKRILAAFARVSRWPYTDYKNGGRDRFPGPTRPGIPGGITYDDPTQEARAPDGIVCSSLTALLMATAYPEGKWTTPAEVGDDVSTYARMQGFRMAAHLADGGTATTASAEVLWDCLDAAVEVGAAREKFVGEGCLDQVPVGYYALGQGWFAPTRGHAILMQRVSEDLWLIIESSGEGPRLRWRSTKWLLDHFDVALGVAVLRRVIPEGQRRTG